MSKIYRVPVYYQLCEYVCVKADSPEEAREYIEENQERFAIHPSQGYYIDDSYEVEKETDMIHDFDESANNNDFDSWNRKNEPFSQSYFDVKTGKWSNEL